MIDNILQKKKGQNQDYLTQIHRPLFLKNMLKMHLRELLFTTHKVVSNLNDSIIINLVTKPFEALLLIVYQRKFCCKSVNQLPTNREVEKST